MSKTDDVIEHLAKTDPERLVKLEQAAIEAFEGHIWIANAGPQLQAFISVADLLLYGGQGGGGKTDLLGGLSLTAH